MDSETRLKADISDESLLNLIENSKLFSNIDRQTCKALLSQFDTVRLAKGEILFEQGAPSDSLYIVAQGHLAAILSTAKKTRVVGMVESGETVGELGALSRQPRSVTIRATTDVLLLKLTRDDLEQFCTAYPSAAFHLMDSIITRSQNTLKLLSEKKIHKHLAIVPANDDVPMVQFLTTLRENLKNNPDVIFVEKNFQDAGDNLLQIMQYVENAERDGKIIFFIIDPDETILNENWMDYIGGLFVVTHDDAKLIYSDFVVDLIDGGKIPFATQKELVILHPDHIERPTGTKRWLEKGHFTLHHHLRMSDNADYQRLIRFMTGKALGVVFGGGGGKGWASIGAFKALLEAGITIDAVGGTSVGAIVAAFYMLSHTYEELFEKFHGLIETLKNPFSWNNFTWPIISLLSAKGPTEYLQNVFSQIQIEDLWRQYFCVSCNLTTGKEAVHRSGMLWEKVRASGSLPGIAPPVVMEGKLHVDGGLLNNLPVDRMRTILGDAGYVIAIGLSDTGKEVVNYNFPPIMPFKVGLLTKMGFGYRNYNFPPFFYTFLKALLVGSSAKEKMNGLDADLFVCPNLSRYQSLDFNLTSFNDLIDIGYRSTVEMLETKPKY